MNTSGSVVGQPFAFEANDNWTTAVFEVVSVVPRSPNGNISISSPQ